MNLNIIPNGAIKRVHISQNDVGRTLTFELFNGSSQYTIPVGATVKIQGTKPSGFGFSETCTVSGNIVTVDTTEEMTDEYGYINTELSISYSGNKIGTSNFVLAVERNPHPDTTTDGSMDTIIPELTLLVNEVKGYAEEIEGTYHAYGSPWVASTVAEMTDTDKIYVYTGSETGYTNGNWYYYNGSAWVSGGVYNSVAVQTDTTLSVSGMPADAKVVGDELSGFSGLKMIEMQGTNQYIKTNLTVGATVSTTPQTSAGFKYAIVPCSAGDKFTINATGGGSPRVWCFVKSDYSLISVDPTSNHTVTDLVLTAPTNSAYLILNDKSGSQSYIGTDRISDTNARVDAVESNLNLYTGGAFSELSANTDLNSVRTVGNYFSTDANANGMTNKPYDTNHAFDLIVKSAFGENTSYLLQYFVPRMADEPISVRSIRSNGTINTEWKTLAYDDVATINKNGLMSKWDKLKLDSAKAQTLFETGKYPSVDSKMAGLLQLEKTECVFHDNFYRADNSTDIGRNGSGSNMYNYYDMAPSATETENIQVGISSHKAVATNPNSVEGSTIRIKYKYTRQSLPYSVTMSFDGMGVLAISPINTNNYLYISATENEFTVGGVGSLAITSVTVTHNLGLSTVVAYVYDNKINVYVAGQLRASVGVSVANMLVGILFRASDVNNIAYTNFDVFNASENLYAYQDEGIESANSFTNQIVNNSETADYSYGVLLDSSVTKYSKKSIRFEQRKADSSSVYRSEITVKNPRGTGYDANRPLQTKLFEYDLYIPEDYGIDTEYEILWQMHHTPDGVVADGLYPNIAFNTKNGKFTLNVRSSKNKPQSSSELETSNEYELGAYTAGQWYHIIVFIREGYLPEHNPCLAIWMDGDLVHYSRETNAYNTTNGSYLKMGVYKPSYVHQADTGTTKRVVYVDNLYVWM